MLWSNAIPGPVARALTGGLALAILLGLGACGFQPLYGRAADGTATTDELAAVRVTPLEDRIGQQFHNLLIDRLNPRGQPVEPAYTLKLELTKSTQGVNVRKDETATRANLILRASFALYAVGSDEALLQGSVNSINSYNILDSQFQTFVSEEDALKRGLRELSDDIRVRLATYFSGAGGGGLS